VQTFRWYEAAIRAVDFAGIVPASRGAHCRPLHPRLASLCCPRNALAKRCGRIPRELRVTITRRQFVRAAADLIHAMCMFLCHTIFSNRRIVRDGIAVV
jgi:hypothetical protein